MLVVIYLCQLLCPKVSAKYTGYNNSPIVGVRWGLKTTFYCCSVTKSLPTVGDPMDCNTPGFPVLHHLPELTQTHVHGLSDAIQPSHPLTPPFPPALNLSQHQGLTALHTSWSKVLELQVQHQSFQ